MIPGKMAPPKKTASKTMSLNKVLKQMALKYVILRKAAENGLEGDHEKVGPKNDGLEQGDPEKVSPKKIALKKVIIRRMVREMIASEKIIPGKVVLETVAPDRMAFDQ